MSLVATISLTSACASSASDSSGGDVNPGFTPQPNITAGVVVDQDAFARTVLDGWGTADRGGVWTVGGAPRADFSVDPSVARMRVPKPGTTMTAYLYGLISHHSISRVDFTFDKAFTGPSRAYVSLAARHSRSGQYRLRVKILGDSAVQISVTKTEEHTDTVLMTRNTKVTFTPGKYLRMRLEVTGSTSVALQGKVWAVDSPEPTTPQVYVRDTKFPLRDGHTGLSAYLSARATNAPVNALFKHLSVTEQII